MHMHCTRYLHYQIFPCDNDANISFTARLVDQQDLVISNVKVTVSFRLKKELALILSQNLADQCGGLFEGKCDAYVLMKIGTNEAEVLRGNRTHKILDDDNPRMTLPSDGYTEKLREYTFRDIVKSEAGERNGSLRVELRLGVFDFNGWSEDKPIGKAKHVFEDVLNLTSTPTDPIVKSICRPELIQKETMAHSNAGVYLGTFLVLVVLVVGGVVLILLLRPAQCCCFKSEKASSNMEMTELQENEAPTNERLATI